uniref:HV80H14.8 n=1 Tax=Hordeum vulgare TaxID=4513 RepID=Q8LLB2_HORVU|nr:HV80H14.8 [Hordeum vulgare subsp. vulgare]
MTRVVSGGESPRQHHSGSAAHDGLRGDGSCWQGDGDGSGYVPIWRPSSSDGVDCGQHGPVSSAMALIVSACWRQCCGGGPTGDLAQGYLDRIESGRTTVKKVMVTEIEESVREEALEAMQVKPVSRDKLENCSITGAALAKASAMAFLFVCIELINAGGLAVA